LDIVTLDEVKQNLKYDLDDHSIDPLIIPLIAAVPNYLLQTTGRRFDVEPINPLAKVAACQIVGFWHESAASESEPRVKRVISSLLSALTNEYEYKQVI
jgi:hypothetical protein